LELQPKFLESISIQFLFLFLQVPIISNFPFFLLHHAFFLFVKVKMKPPSTLQTHFN